LHNSISTQSVVHATREKIDQWPRRYQDEARLLVFQYPKPGGFDPEKYLGHLVNNFFHINELDTPTIESPMPSNLTLAPLLDYEPRSGAGKIIYVLRNIPMPCPPRGTFPVNTRAWFRESVSPQHARFAFGQECDGPSYVAPVFSRSKRRLQFISFSSSSKKAAPHQDRGPGFILSF
jgi:hypothetical protein